MKKIQRIISLFLCLVLLAGCSNGALSPETMDDGNASVGVTSPVPDNMGYNPSIEEHEEEIKGTDETTDKSAKPETTITVLAPDEYSEEDVRKGITFENVSTPLFTSGDPDLLDPDVMQISGGNGKFIVGAKDGFKEGDVYQFVLTDKKLSFEGKEKRIRKYNLILDKEESLDIKLNDSVKFLDADKLNDSEQDTVANFDGFSGYTNDEQKNANSPTIGNFVADNGKYVLGDLIAVYEGKNPEKRDFNDSESGISYIRITDIKEQNGGKAKYYYESASPKDTLFVPDVFPIKADPSFSGGKGSITLPIADTLFKSNDALSEMHLDENTTYDVGDFIAFYDGSVTDGKVNGYAEITKVTYKDENMILDYKETTLEKMTESSQLYRTTYLTDDQIRESYDEEEIKDSILESMNDQQFLTKSTYDLAEAVFDDESVQEKFKNEDINDLNFYFGEDEAVSLSGEDYEKISDGNSYANATNVKGDFAVNITPNIVHFAGKMGYGTGIRAEVSGKYTITIKSEKSKNEMKINLTLFFEVEFMVGLTVDVSTVWKRKWIFPYIYDYSISGRYGVGTYVGVAFTTVAKLVKSAEKETEAEKAGGFDWPENVEKSKGSEKVMKLAESIKKAGKQHDSIFPAQDTAGGSLQKKYAAFNTDVAKSWIDLVDCEIFDWNGAIDPFHVFAFRIKADFVVSATAKAALGIGWTNEAASTNTFNFLLFHEGYSAKKTTSEADNANRFDAYLFGSIGLSAGVRVKLAAGLFDARLDAIGFVVDGGAYINLNGFVYISYEQLGEKKAKWSSCGGMYVDAGLFYMITFVAEMIDGKIGYEKVIESNNYPIFEFGSPNIPLDFAYSQDKKESTEYNLKFKSPDKIAVMPESVFEMKMMDLTDGSVSNLKVGDDDLRKNFEITFDNPALSYDYSDGKHLIRIDYSKRGEKDEGTTTMTIRWKGSSFLQMTSEVERKIKFNWVCDNVSLQFLNRDGSTHCLISKRKGEPITEDEWPKDPTARGYQFTGWVDADGNAVSTPISVMPGDDMVFTSTWSEKPTTLYVEYSYPLWDDKGSIPYYSDTDEITGICKVGDSVDNIIELLKQKNLLKTEKEYSFEGKTALLRYEPKLSDSVISGTVDDDGTARFRIVLKFKKYTVRYVIDEDNIENKQCVIGRHIEFPQVSKKGYNFLGWQDSEGKMVNSYDPPVCNGPETFKAVWEKKKATLTATANLKVKRGWTVGMYSWKNIKTVEMTFDSYEVSVDEVLKRLNTGYTYCTYYNTYPKGSTIKLNEDGSTAVTFYFE